MASWSKSSLSWAMRRVEGLVQVEGRRQRLGHLVEGEQQLVGVGQAAQAVEGQGLLDVGLAGDPPGVAGHQGDQQSSTDHCTEVRTSVSPQSGSKAQGSVTASSDAAAIRSPKPNPRAKPATATAVSAEKTNGDIQYPVAMTALTVTAISVRRTSRLRVSSTYRRGRRPEPV
jgi:hypothetical protein